MKLASYVANGRECYGVVIGDGVATMGHGSLRDALSSGSSGRSLATRAS